MGIPAFLLFSLFFLLHVLPAYAADELILVGIPKGINYKDNTAIIDVHSGSCPGSKKFRVEDTEFLSGLLDRKISFRVDGNSCTDGQLRAIHDFIVQRKGTRP